MFGWYQNCFYLCTLLWEQGVVGSNPATPTEINKLLIFQ